MTPSEALQFLRDGLPADRGLDGERDTAIRSVLNRLKAAEDVCLLYGWSALDDGSDRSKALHELWAGWYDVVGGAYCGPSLHPHLDDAHIAALARQRDATRARTLAAIKAAEPQPVAEAHSE